MDRTELHPTDWPNPADEPWQLVRCPECSMMEWWTEAEARDHGKCRTDPAPCPLCVPLT